MLILATVLSGNARATSDETVARTLAAALTNVGYLDYEHALPLYREAMAASKEGSEPWQEATYGLAICLQQVSPITKNNIDQAVSLFNRLIEKSPQSRFAPRAMMNLGRIEELRDYHNDVIDLVKARGWYQKVLDGWPNDPIAGEATLRIAATHIQTMDVKQDQIGIDILKKWLAAHPKEELASIMWQYIAETYFYPMQDYQQSLEAYEKVDQLGWTDEGNQGRVYWRIAVMCDKYLKNRDAAIKYYTKIIKETPTTGKAYEAQVALRELGAPVPEIEIFEPSPEEAPSTQPAEAQR